VRVRVGGQGVDLIDAVSMEAVSLGEISFAFDEHAFSDALPSMDVLVDRVAGAVGVGHESVLVIHVVDRETWELVFSDDLVEIEFRDKQIVVEVVNDVFRLRVGVSFGDGEMDRVGEEGVDLGSNVRLRVHAQQVIFDTVLEQIPIGQTRDMAVQGDELGDALEVFDTGRSEFFKDEEIVPLTGEEEGPFRHRISDLDLED